MKIIFACLFVSIIAIPKDDDLLLNGLEFPSYIYVPLDKSYLLECNSKVAVYWKLYLNNGKIEIINDPLIRLNEFDKNRDGFYQCYTNENSHNVFIFSNGARSIDRHWTELKEFHNDLLTICQPIYFNYGFNEQFIELIDSKQTVRYNRSALLVKHIRSTTHLFCKLHIDTTIVGIRVQTLIGKDFGSPLLSDKSLKANDYLEMNTNERDVYRIAFEDDSIYLHCPSKNTSPVHWHFLSWNYYSMKTLPILYNQDTKITSVKISDAGMYTCQTENTTHKRIILTIIHPPKSPDNIYEHTLNVDLNSKYLICCNLDAIPYPTYSWSMITEIAKKSFIWCLKRCCWLHIIYKEYRNIICTSSNQFGMAKYNIHLIVHDTGSKGKVVYDEPKSHSHSHHTNDFNLIRKIKENHSLLLNSDIEDDILDLLTSSSNNPDVNSSPEDNNLDQMDELIAQELREHSIEHKIDKNETKIHVNIQQKFKTEP